MEVRKTVPADLDGIMEVIEQGREYLRSQGIDQWQNGYPNRDSFLADIAEGNSYVLTDGEQIYGVYYLKFGDDPDYSVIEDGAWPDHEPYAVIHRMGIRAENKGRGYAGIMFAAAAEKAKEKGVFELRIDTHEKNLSMQRAVTKFGFVRCGRVYIGGTAPRIAFAKRL